MRASGDAFSAAVEEMELTMQCLQLVEAVDNAVEVPVVLNAGGNAEAEKALYNNIQDNADKLTLRGM